MHGLQNRGWCCETDRVFVSDFDAVVKTLAEPTTAEKNKTGDE